MNEKTTVKTMQGVNQRQVNIVNLLMKHKYYTCEELSNLLGVSIRTIKYDIAYLKKVYPNNFVVRRGRYCRGIEWVTEE